MESSPTIVVIFGGAGDLTWRKVMPSLFDLHRKGQMSKQFAIVAIDRATLRDAQAHKYYRDGVNRFSPNGKTKGTDWPRFSRHVTYQQGDVTDQTTYSHLGERCAQLERTWKAKATHVFYMATPPSMMGVIPDMLAAVGLNRDRARARIVVEKPIGHDL